MIRNKGNYLHKSKSKAISQYITLSQISLIENLNSVVFSIFVGNLSTYLSISWGTERFSKQRKLGIINETHQDRLSVESDVNKLTLKVDYAISLLKNKMKSRITTIFDFPQTLFVKD